MIPLSCLQHIKRTRTSNGGLGLRPNAPPAFVVLSALYDRSGSMGYMDKAARAGLQNFIKEHKVLADANKKMGTKTFFSLTTFDDTAMTYFDNVDMTTLAAFTPEQMQEMCFPRGMTRLVDTMFEQLLVVNRKVRAIVSAMPRKVRALHPKIVAIFLSITDGGDNMSSLYLPVDLNQLVARSRAKGVDILFLGANQDAIQTAASFGIGAGQALTFGATPHAATAAFQAATQVTYRSATGDMQSAPTFTQMHRDTSAPTTIPQTHPGTGGYRVHVPPLRHYLGGGGGNVAFPLHSFHIPPPPKMTRMSTVSAYHH